ncbi:dephospho-CoA kinase [Corynebacterium lactis]|uniref:Dephospho-CoA kinase n=1 Tax=Corynebacterium lactis RW2-5 TaxID=1408189 RepID=A0A0K2H0J0_9CORY|nr:dephospho-CoA kinase [Corynebacterium lactis]ALA67549.1 dephospho-CoA kinase [Corynebacterium lactis RW2-5]
MLKIGLTGGMGSGKSTAAARLAELGATIIDADQVAREVVEPGQPALAELAAEFGEDILFADGSLNRGLLAERAFASESATAALNAITHPRINVRTAELYDAVGDAIVVYDMPLLIEKGLDADQDLVIVVHAPVQQRLDRLVNSRGVNREDAARRIAAQVDDATRLSKADIVLDNSAGREELIRQVDAAWKERILPAAAR